MPGRLLLARSESGTYALAPIALGRPQFIVISDNRAECVLGKEGKAQLCVGSISLCNIAVMNKMLSE